MGVEIDEFASGLGIEPTQLRDLETSLSPVPRLVAARALWTQDNQSRLNALNIGDLPKCQWAEAWENVEEETEDPDIIAERFDAFNAHFRDCGICQDRAEYLATKFPPQAAYPMGGPIGIWVAVVSWFDRLAPFENPDVANLPHKLLRNVLLGASAGAVFAAFLLALPAALGIVYVLFQLIFTPPLNTGETLEAVAFAAYYVAAGGAAGAAGGLVWKAVAGRKGYMVVGVVALSVFMFLLIVDQEGDPRLWEQWEWYGWAFLSVIFGIAAGYGLGKEDL